MKLILTYVRIDYQDSLAMYRCLAVTPSPARAGRPAGALGADARRSVWFLHGDCRAILGYLSSLRKDSMQLVSFEVKGVIETRAGSTPALPFVQSFNLSSALPVYYSVNGCAF